MSKPVVTSQPVPSAPLEEKATEAIMNGVSTGEIPPIILPSESVVVTQPIMAAMPAVSSMDSEKLIHAQVDAMEQLKLDEEERRKQRENDFCCFACADSYADDTWCWYILCRMYCRCLGTCCESCANCCDSCGEGCASCLHDCCESNPNQSGNDSGCFCCGGDGNDGCCSGDAGASGDAGGGDCDCDCDCGGCFD